MARASAATEKTYELDPILDFMRLLWSVEHGLERMSKRMGAELGITGPQRLVLRIVGRFPGLSAGDLAHIVRLHPSTITGILQRLVDRGLIERERHPDDSRRAILKLAAEASSYTRGSRSTVERAVTQTLEHVGAANVRAARKVLSELAKRLNEP
jgi:DNA-binding MarR family transcriptional regulator